MFQGKLIRVVYLTIFVLFISLTAAKAQHMEEQKKEKPDKIIIEPEVIGESKPYTLGKEDVLQITVQNQAEFSGRYVIGPDGNIQYSYAGDIKAEGLNKEELKVVLINKLSKFVKNPVVSVAIVEYRSKIVYILGDVGRPGKYPMKGDTLSLRDAIVDAGLPTRTAALRRTYIFKSDPVNPTYKKVDLFKLLYRGITKDNVDLVSGDIVVVPSTVPAEINRALATLLAPFGQAQRADDVITHSWGQGDDD